MYMQCKSGIELDYKGKHILAPMVRVGRMVFSNVRSTLWSINPGFSVDNIWKSHSLYVTASSFRLVFYAHRGQGLQGDFAIDDVTVSEIATCDGASGSSQLVSQYNAVTSPVLVEDKPSLPVTSGVMTSTNYPQPYSPNYRVVWNITIESWKYFLFQFEYLDLELCCDYVEIGDTKYSGSLVDNSDSIQVNESSLIVKFYSDYSVSRNGFKLKWTSYQFQDPPTVKPPVTKSPVPYWIFIVGAITFVSCIAFCTFMIYLYKKGKKVTKKVIRKRKEKKYSKQYGIQDGENGDIRRPATARPQVSRQSEDLPARPKTSLPTRPKSGMSPRPNGRVSPIISSGRPSTAVSSRSRPSSGISPRISPSPRSARPRTAMSRYDTTNMGHMKTNGLEQDDIEEEYYCIPDEIDYSREKPAPNTENRDYEKLSGRRDYHLYESPLAVKKVLPPLRNNQQTVASDPDDFLIDSLYSPRVIKTYPSLQPEPEEDNFDEVSKPIIPDRPVSARTPRGIAMRKVESSPSVMSLGIPPGVVGDSMRKPGRLPPITAGRKLDPIF